MYKQHIPLAAYQYGTTTISPELYNYAINYSLTGNIDYFFVPMEKIFVPYAGAGIGIAYNRFTQYL
ncbi:MAG: hypothetical protein QM734_07240 [Cyclobacteriaceae bacterium]